MNNWIYIAIMLSVTVAIREIPILILRKPIGNRFIRSFLYYVPYVTLAVMTFPAILHVTQNPIVGAAALIIGILLAWIGVGMFPTAILCCILVLLLEFLIK